MHDGAAAGPSGPAVVRMPEGDAFPPGDRLPEVCVGYLLRERDGHDEVLLGRKKHGLGEGRFVAPGGKLEPGESPLEALVREVAEEVGIEIEPARLEARGMLDYYFPHRPAWSQRSHVFVARGVEAEPVESDELDAAWLRLDAVPYASMWDDARFWLPGVLAGGRVRRAFAYADDLASVEVELALEPPAPRDPGPRNRLT